MTFRELEDAGVERRKATLADAIRIVATDQRKNDWPERDTDADLVNYVRNAICLPGEGPSNWQVEDDGSVESEAYIMVLKATPEEIELAFGMPPYTPKVPAVKDLVQCKCGGKHVGKVVGVLDEKRLAVAWSCGLVKRNVVHYDWQVGTTPTDQVEVITEDQLTPQQLLDRQMAGFPVNR